MIKGKSADYIKKMSDSIYEALVEAYQMAENDLFQIIEQLEPGGFIRLPGGDRFEEVAVGCLRTWPLRIYGIGLTSGIGLSHKVNSRYGPSDKLFMFFYDSCVLFLHIKI